ncbi:YxiG-like protein [Streptosporangium sandarakinum]|uniref:YxiG-like protein n=1 Tax=Streptosporangium sandarakinum TaxID=1260955 RepID=UPI003F4D0BCC
MPPPRSRCPPVCLRYLFRYCVEARTGTSVRRDVWRVALDDRLLEDDSFGKSAVANEGRGDGDEGREVVGPAFIAAV